jgi:uncharacterized membrane protein (UPF0127 family)
MESKQVAQHAFLFILALVVVVAGVFYAYNQFRPTYALAHIERADTSTEREQGLSGRVDIPEDYGMLFVFPEKGDYAFWMKDMLVPIDILWLSDTGTITGIERSVQPATYPSTFHPPLPVRYVLETRAGTATARGWNVGTILTLPIY